MSLCRARAVGLTILFVVGAPVGAAAVESLSPGSIALLVTEPTLGAGELQLCRQALASPSAELRGAAARVARVRAAKDLAADLARALAAETDVAAAREELLALGWLADASADDVRFAAASRFDGSLDGFVAQSVGLRGPSALDAFERLATLEPDASSWTAFFRWATRGHPDSLVTAARMALAHGNSEAWNGLLGLGTRAAPSVDDAALASAAGSANPRVREKTYYYLLEPQDGRDSLGPATKAALASTPEGAEPPGNAAAAVAFELLERSLGRAPKDVSALLGKLEHDQLRRIPIDRWVLARLRGDEREVFGERRFGDKGWVGRRMKSGTPPPSLVERDMPNGRRIRTASDFPPGVVSDVLRLTGCDLPSEPVAWNGVEAQFDGDAVKHITFYPMLGPAQCVRAVRTLLLMSVVPSDRPPLAGQTQMILLPMDAGFAGCVDHAAPPRPQRASDDDSPVGPQTIREPRKTRNVLPHYPAKARNERRSGVVYVESVVDTTGCIRSSEILSAPSVDLAGEAIRTVTQWRYTPTLLNGQPVPVIMTITVNFRLN